jgi:hypothetical protein
MTYEEFTETYKPVTNHFQEAGFNGWLFETYGQELEHVQNTESEYIWTVLECEDRLYLTAGFHVVNRLGYFITSNPWTDENIAEDILID